MKKKRGGRAKKRFFFCTQKNEKRRENRIVRQGCWCKQGKTFCQKKKEGVRLPQARKKGRKGGRGPLRTHYDP